jgi:2'-5' RNA ligase
MFTAIELGEAARQAIVQEQHRIADDLGDASRSMRFVGADHLHLTLVFIGEVSESGAPAVVTAMQQDIPVAPFEIAFGGIGTFPPRGAPRVLWLGTIGGAEEAIALQAVVAGRLAVAGVAPESRPYKPHLTLARWRENRDQRAARGWHALERLRGQDKTPRVIARADVLAVTLFHGRLSPRGSTYTPLAHAHLSA